MTKKKKKKKRDRKYSKTGWNTPKEKTKVKQKLSRQTKEKYTIRIGDR